MKVTIRTRWSFSDVRRAALVLAGLACVGRGSLVQAQDDLKARHGPKVKNFEVYLAGSASASGTIVDKQNNVVGSFPIGATGGDGVAITHDGKRAYVAIGAPGLVQAPGSISVIDTVRNTVIASIPTPNSPHRVAITPNDDFAYVTSDFGSSVFVVDTKSNTISDTITAGQFTDRLAITPDGARVYVANAGDNTVSVIDTATQTVIDTIVLAPSPTALGRPFGIAANPNGQFVYVTNQNAATVSVIETATNTVVATVNVDFAPQEVVVSPDGAFAFIASAVSNNLDIVATATNQVVAAISLAPACFTPENPSCSQVLENLTISPDGALVYASLDARTLLVVDAAQRNIVAQVDVGPIGLRGIAIRRITGNRKR